MLQVQASEVQLQIDGFRRQCKTAFDDDDGLVEASGPGELPGEFLEGRQKWRAPRRRLAQLFDRFRAASGAAQRRPKQGFDTGVASAARGSFEGRNRLPCPVESEQGMSQDRCGGSVGPAAFQDLGGELLCLGKPLCSQREGGAFEQRGAASAADGWGKWRFRHGACHCMASAMAIMAANQRPERDRRRSGVAMLPRGRPEPAGPGPKRRC